jgi:hypothetical protein
MNQIMKSRDGNAKNDAIKYPLRSPCEKTHVRLQGVHLVLGDVNVL